jgi:hypothetical protein
MIRTITTIRDRITIRGRLPITTIVTIKRANDDHEDHNGQTEAHHPVNEDDHVITIRNITNTLGEVIIGSLPVYRFILAIIDDLKSSSRTPESQTGCTIVIVLGRSCHE